MGKYWRIDVVLYKAKNNLTNAKTMLENCLVGNPQDTKLIREKLVKIKLIYDLLKEANICM